MSCILTASEAPANFFCTVFRKTLRIFREFFYAFLLRKLRKFLSVLSVCHSLPICLDSLYISKRQWLGLRWRKVDRLLGHRTKLNKSEDGIATVGLRGVNSRSSGQTAQSRAVAWTRAVTAATYVDGQRKRVPDSRSDHWEGAITDGPATRRWNHSLSVQSSCVTRVFGARGGGRRSNEVRPCHSCDVDITPTVRFLLKVAYFLRLAFSAKWQANLLKNCTTSIQKRGNTKRIKAK